MLTSEQNRIFDDLLTSERALRTAAENNNRRLLMLLPEIASHLDGTRYEEMRKQDHAVPGSWSPEDWRNFFMSISLKQAKTDGWGMKINTSDSSPSDTIIAEQIAQLTSALAAEKKKTETLVAENNRLHANQPKFEHKRKHQAPQVTATTTKAAQPAIGDSVAGTREPSSYPGILADFQEFMQRVGEKPAHEYKELGEGNRPWKRYAGFIYLIGHWGINSKQELLRLMGDKEGIGGNSSSLTNILDNLLNNGYLICDVLDIEGAEMKISFWRLSPAGQVLFQKITGTTPVECEWSRLIRLSASGIFTGDLGACLTFAFHARKRGWGVIILPKTDGSFEPHILIQHGDERIFVRFEGCADDKSSSWPNLAAANGGFIALCAANASQRAQLMDEYKSLKISGKATDIQALSAGGYSNVHVGAETWVETW